MPDSLCHRDGRTLEFEHAQRNPVHIQHDVGALGAALGISPGNGDLFRDSKVVGRRVGPVDQPNRLVVFTYPGRDLHAITQPFIHGAIHVIGDAGLIPSHPLQFGNGAGDQRFVILALEPSAEVFLLDVSVAGPVVPVPKIFVAKRIAEQLNHPVLGRALDLADCAHTSLIRPVRSC